MNGNWTSEEKITYLTSKATDFTNGLRPFEREFCWEQINIISARELGAEAIIDCESACSGAYTLLNKSVEVWYCGVIHKGILTKDGFNPYIINGLEFWPKHTMHHYKDKQVIGGYIQATPDKPFTALDI